MEHQHQKNWFQRHWKWFVPTLLILICITIVQSPLGGAAKDFGSLYANPSLYEDALVQVREHQDASELLGAPIEAGFLIEGEVLYAENGNSVVMTIPVKGSKAKGRLDIKAHKVANAWVYTLLRVRTKKPKVEVLIHKTE